MAKYSLSLGSTIATKGLRTNIDYYYGPYTVNAEASALDLKKDDFLVHTLNDILTKLKNVADVGYTIGVYTDDTKNKIKEYWCLKGADSKLTFVEKGVQLGLTGVTFIAAVEDNSVTFTYTPDGSSLFGSQAVILRENNSILHAESFNQEGSTFSITNVQEGKHTYTLTITDIFGKQIMKTAEVSIGLFKVVYNKTDFDRITKLNKTNLIDKILTINILIIDNDWAAAEYKLQYNTDFTALSALEQNTINLTEQDLSKMEGGTLTVVGTLNDKSVSYPLFTVLDSKSLTVQLLSSNTSFYTGITALLKLLFASGANNMQISAASASDFTFQSTTLLFDSSGHQTINLNVTPKKIKQNAAIVFEYLNGQIFSLQLGNIENVPDFDRGQDWNFNNNKVVSCYIDFTGIIPRLLDPNERILQLADQIYIDGNVIYNHGIKVATPLELEVYVGFGVNLTDTNQNTNESVNYNCICIDGTIVKINENTAQGYVQASGTFNSAWENTTILFKQDATNKLCRAVSYAVSGKKDDNKFIWESNYYHDFNITTESSSIQTLYLKYEDHDLLQWSSKSVYKAIFGSLADGFNKYLLAPNSLEGSMLLKQKTDLKSVMQKLCGVPCKYLVLNTDPLESAWSTADEVTVYTQGTSTLDYAIPNFKLYFNNPYQLSVGDTIYTESVLTAKADYMESAHLNNTPTAMLYNKIVASDLINTKSPNVEARGIDAIAGIPIIIKVMDKDKTEWQNFGSFMLNIDKAGDSLFKNENCLSFEGTSNSSSDTASQFYTTDASIQEIIDKTESLSDAEKDSLAKFLSGGFEYRYPDRDIYKDNGLAMPDGDFNVFFSTWKWVNSLTGTETKEEFKNAFKTHFNVEYSTLYFIMMMALGQTDNLGKNCMFDFWKIDDTWSSCFPRPYDLDSELGLNNGGIEAIPPFTQMGADYLPPNVTPNLIPPSMSYKYISNAEPYGYSSSESKLWKYFYKYYYDEIVLMYTTLRTDETYNFLDTLKLIKHYEDIILKVIPVSLYNIDFENKYLGTPQQHYMLGNRKTNFKDWITARLAFCDSFFQINSVKYSLRHQHNLIVKSLFPAYISTTYESRDPNIYFTDDTTELNIWIGNEGNVTNTISLADSIITDISVYNSTGVGITGADTFKFTNLQSLALDGTAIPNTDYLNTLTKLTINSSFSNANITIPKSVRLLSSVSSTVTSITFSEESRLETCYIANFNGSLDFGNCSKLKYLTLNNCTIFNLAINNATLDTLSITACKFTNSIKIENSHVPSLNIDNQSVSSLTINNSTVNNLSCFGTTFTTNVLDLASVSQLQTLNLINSKGLKHIVREEQLTELQLLSIQDSDVTSISDSVENDILDLSLIPATTQSWLNKSSSAAQSPVLVINNMQNTVTDDLSFCNTKIKNVNIDKNMSGFAMFANCKDLLSVYASQSYTISSDWVFYNCPNLTTLTNIKINKFLGAFVGLGTRSNPMNYTMVETCIDSNAEDANFNYFLYKAHWPRQATIDLAKYPSISSLTLSFATIHYSAHANVTSSKTTGCNLTIKLAETTNLNVTELYRTFAGHNSITILDSNDQPANYFNSNNEVQSLVGTFLGSNSSPCTLNFDVNELLNHYAQLTTLDGTFAYCTFSFTDTSIQLPSTIQNARGTFWMSILNNNPELAIDGLLSTNTNEEVNISSCFYGVPTAYIKNTFNISDTVQSINVAGFLGVTTGLKDLALETHCVSSPKIYCGSLTHHTYTSYDKDSQDYNGAFQNRRISDTNISLSGNTALPAYFKSSSFSNKATITITGVEDIDYILLAADNFSITLNGNIKTARYAFKGATRDEYISINLSTLQNAEHMFELSNITKILFTLPSSITNIDYMFSHCIKLKDGVPQDFFANATNLTLALYLFNHSCINAKTDDDTTRNLTIPANIVNVQGMFASTRLFDSLHDVVLSGYLTSIVGLFANSTISIPTIQLALNVLADYAFVNKTPDTSWYTFKDNINSAIGMFASVSPNDINLNNIDNLVPNNGSVLGMFYNWTNVSSSTYSNITQAVNIPEQFKEETSDLS